jgi:hypothetical protein
MQRRKSLLRRFGGLSIAVLVILVISRDCCGDVLYSGTGASAYVVVLGHDNNQDGSIPASLSGSATVTYTIYPFTPGGSSYVTATASASATPGATNLLQIQNYLSATAAQGQVVGAYSTAPESQAFATWGNVAATVQAPTGSPLPASIQLEFRINYQNPDPTAFNALGTPNNGLGSPANPLSLTVNGYPIYLTGAGTPLQAGEQPVQTLPNGMLSGTFHLDLPLSSSGTSSLFSISLGSDLAALGQTLSDTKSLSLLGIDLPDGTPIPADYNVSFDSGQPTPPPPPSVPEPAPLAVWGLLAGIGALIVHRRKSIS